MPSSDIYSMKENIKKKNFVAHPVVHALKTKQVGNVFSLQGCQANPALVNSSNGGWKKAH